ncbi:hypothetical protein [Erythrobacter sp.]|uniref:hypothetical protein n=1 Tax=Erythrobacter sp. TaxID=1042 RepID=UPI001B17396B|nr:hypothetical protein [Erythrobacter sp.]MBO6526004.1 hypothetical protein [Erythrobacter sp.]MBO6530647.1 hypothetical protein [Erythrobacter sp.]
MSEFSITFELFLLLLGLAMAEGLAGFARAFKLRSRIRHGRGTTAGKADREQIRIGWLVPLAALVVLCHQSTFWLFLYDVRGNVPLNFLSVLALLGLIGWYYLISAMLWPDAPEAWPDFDAYYMAHRRFVWFGVIGIGLIAELGRTVYSVESELRDPAWMYRLADWSDTFGTLALLALPFVSHARWALGLLVLILAHFAVSAAVSPWIPF